MHKITERINMPNIEIHGLPFEKAVEIRERIFRLFEGKSYFDEMVVTISRDVVMDAEGRDKPFLRLANSCQDYTDEILDLLRSLKMDIEQIILVKFIPAKT